MWPPIACGPIADRTLFVILGAGASYAASSDYFAMPYPHSPERPPLVPQLFDERFSSILSLYPMAKNAAPDIRDAMAGSGRPALSLEDYLRVHYRDSDDELDRRRFLSIPLYLQHVLWKVSEPHNLQLDNLDRLINRLLAEFAHVCFITLNYDLLLDRSLNAINGLHSMDSFIGQTRWSLIKLHGSITWGYRLPNVAGADLNNPPAELEIDASEIFHTWEIASSGPIRAHERPSERFNSYPALSVPLGPQDDIACPPEHEQFLRAKLKDAKADVLVSGYSGLDETVLQLLGEETGEIRTLTVVNAGAAEARAVAEHMCDKLGLDISGGSVTGSPEPFEVWVQRELPSYAEWVAA